MSREYAELLAQVIPVVALALGFEIRSLAKRIRESGSKPVPNWQRNLLFQLCIILVVLALGEMRALSVVAGDGFVGSFTVTLVLAITAAFVAPLFDAIKESMPPVKREDLRLIFRTKLGLASLPLFFAILLVIAAAIAMQLMSPFS
ncbi:hypothetical protein ACFY1S_12625 [Micromonospora sp. NPDC000663]|uniref:hypothetical protein n=1 Tax=Micromonospora sp. NPDC000663 TaxID=3364218 RepID=UPI0036BBB810